MTEDVFAEGYAVRGAGLPRLCRELSVISHQFAVKEDAVRGFEEIMNSE